jgi:hypothetical protein
VPRTHRLAPSQKRMRPCALAVIGGSELAFSSVCDGSPFVQMSSAPEPQTYGKIAR